MSNTYTLKIYRSDTGSVYEIPVNSPSILIETIKESIQSITNLAPSEQILLADTNLFSNRTLESYGITKDKDIYLFNKRIIDNPNLKPEEIEIPIDDLFNQPKIPIYKNIRELENSNNPIHKLNAFDMHLRNQFLQIQYIKETFDNKLVQCQNLLYEIIVQKKSISFALNNFREYRESFINIHNNFLLNFKRISGNCESLLLTFEGDMSKLKLIKLHESHRTAIRNTLGDCIPEQDVRRWNEQSKRDYEIMKSKIQEVDFQITAVNDSVDYELKKLPNLSNDNDVSERIKIIIEHCKQLQSFLLTFSSNSEKIKRYMDQITRGGVDSSQVSNLILSFQEIKSQQEFTLNNSTILNNEVMKSITIINKAKNFMSNYSFDVLRNISRLQDKIRTIKSSYSIWNEALNKLSTTFLQLEIIHRFPQAYEESINETIRRKRFGNSLINSFTRYIDSLNNIRDEENQKRTKYLEQFFNYIPNNISFFQGLKELLPKFMINLPEFDILLNNNSNSNNSNSNNNNNSFNNNTSNSQGFSYSGNNSQGSFQDEDEEFTVIEGINNDYFNQSSSSQTNINNSSISPGVSKKYQMELEKSLTEFKFQESQKIKMLESKLQSTFLLASKTDEKYKDLLEKTKIQSQSHQLDKSTFIDSQQKVEDLKSALEEKKLEVSTLQSEINRVTEESNQYVKKIELLNTNQIIYDDKIQKYKETIDRLEKDMELAQQQIDNLGQINEKTIKEIETYESNISSLKEDNSSSTKLKDLEIEKLTNEISYLQQSSNNNKKDKDNYIQNLSDQVSQLTCLMEEKEKLVASLNTDCSELKEAIGKLETDLKISESNNSKILNQVNEYHIQNKFLTESNKTKDDTILLLSDQLKQSEEVVLDFNNKSQVLDHQNENIEILSRTISDQNKTIADQNQTIANQKLQHQQSVVALTTRDGMIKELEEEIDSFERTISQQTKQINELDTTLLQHKEHLSEKNHSMESNDKVLVSQQEEIIKLRQQEKELQAKVKMLESQNQDGSRDKLYIQQLESDSQQKAQYIKELYDQIAMMEELKDYQNLVQQISSIIQPKSQGILDRVTILKSVSEIKLLKDTGYSLEQTIQKQIKEMDHMKLRIEELENTNIAFQIHKEQNPHHLPQIKQDNNALLSEFSHSRNAIFLPNSNGFYEALNINAPLYFLSSDSQGSFEKEMKAKKPIMGTIIEIETKTSGQADSFLLPPGTTFHEVLLGRID